MTSPFAAKTFNNCIITIFFYFDGFPEVFMTGGTIRNSDGTYISESDEILEFNPYSGQWTLVDRMIIGRLRHAVSTIKYSDVAQYCN